MCILFLIAYELANANGSIIFYPSSFYILCKWCYDVQICVLIFRMSLSMFHNQFQYRAGLYSSR